MRRIFEGTEGLEIMNANRWSNDLSYDVEEDPSDDGSEDFAESCELSSIEEAFKLLNEADDEEADKEDDKVAEDPAQAIDQLKNTSDYASFVKLLASDIKSKNFIDYLRKHYKTGDNTIETIKAAKAEERKIACKDLIPTQNEISLSKSLGSVSDLKYAKQAMDAQTVPCIVYAGKYIIDGHHRWSRIYAFAGPNAQLPCINFSTIEGVSVIDMLKAAQLAVVNAQGGAANLINPVKSDNMLQSSPEEIKKYVLDNIKDEVVTAYSQKVKCDATKEACADKLAQNVASLQKTSQPIKGASARDVMPQTDANSIAKMEKEIVDLTEATLS